MPTITHKQDFCLRVFLAKGKYFLGIAKMLRILDMRVVVITLIANVNNGIRILHKARHIRRVDWCSK